MSLETKQLRLKLTENKQVLAALRKKGALRPVKKNGVNVEAFVTQFDSQEFQFVKGVIVTVPRHIGNGLRRSSGVILGDDLTGEIFPAIDQVGEFTLGEQLPEEKKSVTACPVCEKDFKSLIRLSRHLAIAHKNDRADLYVVEEKSEGTDWDVDLEELEAQQEKERSEKTTTKKKSAPATLLIEEIDEEEENGNDDSDNDEEENKE